MRERPAVDLLREHPRGLDGPWQVRGHLVGDPEPARNRSVLRVRTVAVRIDGAWVPARLDVGLTIYEGVPPPSWRDGAGFEAFVRLRESRPAANPGGGIFSPSRARGIDLRSALKSFRQLRSRAPPPPWRRHRSSLRDRIRAAIARTHPGDAEVVRALLLGERAAVASATRTRLQRAGLAHLLAVSGLHVALLAGGVFALLRGVGLPRPSVAAATLLAVLAVSTIVTDRPPVRRAALMATVAFTALAVGRRLEATDALALAALVLAAVDPWVVRDPGFRLTVAATASILLLARARPGPGARSPPPNALGRRLVAAAKVTLAAQAAAVPLLAAGVHRVPLAGPAANLLAVPLLAIVLAAAPFAVALEVAGLSAAAGAVGRLDAAILRTIDGVAERTSETFGALLVPQGREPFLLGFGAGLVALAVLRATPGGPRRGAAVGAVWILLLACGAGAVAPVDRGAHASLVALDVGQGDALLVRTPAGESLVVDAGGSPWSDFDPGSAIVAPALRALGIGTLDAVAVTHLHEDHSGGIAGLLGELPAARIWLGSVRPGDLGRLAPRLPAALSLAAGHRRPGTGCGIRALNPDPRRLPAGGSAPDNDGSLVLAVECGRAGFLLTGDIEADAEAGVASRLLQEPSSDTRPTAVWVLKVPHHGSATSSTTPLLDAVETRHAIVSVGWRNRFGMPRPEVLERLRERGIAVYRTDRDGAVVVTLGDRIRVRGLRWTSGAGRGAAP